MKDAFYWLMDLPFLVYLFVIIVTGVVVLINIADAEPEPPPQMSGVKFTFSPKLPASMRPEFTPGTVPTSAQVNAGFVPYVSSPSLLPSGYGILSQGFSPEDRLAAGDISFNEYVDITRIAGDLGPLKGGGLDTRQDVMDAYVAGTISPSVAGAFISYMDSLSPSTQSGLSPLGLSSSTMGLDTREQVMDAVMFGNITPNVAKALLDRIEAAEVATATAETPDSTIVEIRDTPWVSEFELSGWGVLSYHKQDLRWTYQTPSGKIDVTDPSEFLFNAGYGSHEVSRVLREALE